MPDSEVQLIMRLDRTAQWYWEQDSQFLFTKFDALDGEEISSSPVLSGSSWGDLHPLNFEDRDWNDHLETLNAKEPFFNLELLLPRDAGDSQWLSLCGVPIIDAAGVFKGYRGVGKDISKLKNLEVSVAELALYDQLTGLSNRRLLLERLNSARLNCLRSHEYAALLFIDINNFKGINETLGHAFADGLLVQVGARISNAVRESDTVARIGGDIFVVLATSLGDSLKIAAQNAQRIADKIFLALSAEFTVSSSSSPISNSMGISLFNGVDMSIEEVMKRAEVALKQAKDEGQHTARFFDPLVETHATERKRTQRELSHAIDHGQLLLYYQPIVNLKREIVGYEALIRWNHPTQGIVAPNKFIDIAEQSGLIVPMGEWVIEQACRQLTIFSANSVQKDLTIAVNLSAHQLAHPSLVDSVTNILQRSGALANRLKLEITETMLLTEMEKTVEKLHQLSSLGIRFSLDDFGTGYSSLSYLKKLPLSVLKIDQSFVKELLIDPVDAAIVRTILQLARSLGLSVIAEGVELEGQRKVLAEMGCQKFQGYLFGKPAPLP